MAAKSLYWAAVLFCALVAETVAATELQLLIGKVYRERRRHPDVEATEEKPHATVDDSTGSA